jgi:hypothetical protein
MKSSATGRPETERDASEPDELISAVVDAVARDCFQRVLKKITAIRFLKARF